MRFVKAAAAIKEGNTPKSVISREGREQISTLTQGEASQTAGGEGLAPGAHDPTGSDAAQHVVQAVVLAAELGRSVCDGGEGSGHPHHRTDVEGVAAHDVGDALGLRVQDHVVGGQGETSDGLQ